jgi:hypothetical protein
LGGWARGRSAHFLQAMEAFPRHKMAGALLSIIGVCWACFIFLSTPDDVLGGYAKLKVYMYGFAPLMIYGLIFHLEDLLAPRMLGCVLILLGEPILDAIRWHPSPLRFLVTVFIYAVVVLSMILVLYPYRFRQWVRKYLSPTHRVRSVGGGLMGYGALLVALGLTVFRAPF